MDDNTQAIWRHVCFFVALLMFLLNCLCLCQPEDFQYELFFCEIQPNLGFCLYVLTEYFYAQKWNSKVKHLTVFLSMQSCVLFLLFLNSQNKMMLPFEWDDCSMPRLLAGTY